MNNQYPVHASDARFAQNQMNNQPYPGQQPDASYIQHQQQPMSAPEPQYPQNPQNPQYPQYPQSPQYPQREQGYPAQPPYQGYEQQLAHTPVPNYQPQPPQGGQMPYDGQNYGADGIVRTSDMGGMYAENRYQTYRDAMGNVVENRQQVFENQNQMRANIRYWTTTTLSFLLGVLEVILLLRLIFRLLGANTSNNFILFLYGLSHPFVGAFNGIFNDQTIGKAGVFEVSTLIAMLVYALLVWGLISLVKIIFAPIHSSRQSVTTTRRSQY